MADITNLETKKTLKSGLILAAYAGICTLCMAATYAFVKPAIEENKAMATRTLVDDLIPADILAERPLLVPIYNVPPDEANLVENMPNELGAKGYLMCVGKKVEGVVLETFTNQGYSGEIHLIVGVRRNGKVMGVRVVGHEETPGVGDYIAEKPVPGQPTVWVSQFDNEQYTSDTDYRWAVRKDGGVFDYVAGATVSPRAVLGAVKKILITIEHDKKAYFDVPNACK